ncbi:MAG: NAD-dependent malic enzyme, partial [Thermoanaerobaculia bacterium]|nr:NAD-dependent malic enzyme [Thermoanaerobaculia bacterium]
WEHVTRKSDPLEQFIGLVALEGRNAVLFYRLLTDHFESLLPIVYTPTVGRACQEFSHIFRQGRGLWITPDDRGRVREVLGHAPWEGVRLIVATDNERILGLGDQGAGGMWIPVGKLALYVAAAGFHPTQCLPISLDVGTDNRDLLEDELYIGWRGPRLRGAAYDELVEEFVEAVRDRFPDALLQWEDFKKANAFRLLDRYSDRLPSFNDDIQGTAGVALAGLMAASRVSGVPMAEQRIVLAGAGAAGVGIARQLRDAMRREGLAEEEILRRIALLDSTGLLVEGRAIDDAHKREFVWPRQMAADCGFTGDGPFELDEVVRLLEPTALIGTSGQPGLFGRSLVEEMAAAVERPAIFPFSNPTSKSEATPEELVEWTSGRALIATGSPFEPVRFGDRLIETGQGNNVYIFPGVGLGVVVSGARRVVDAMFTAAAETLAASVTEADLARGSLYPRLGELRAISRRIAAATARVAFDEELAEPLDEETLDRRLEEFVWSPDYPRVRLG